MFTLITQKLNALINNKKLRYLLLSIVTVLALYVMTMSAETPTDLFYLIGFVLLFAVGSVLVAQFTSLISTSYVLFMVLPVHLVIGFMTSFYFFPNLSVLIKMIAFILAGIIIYVLFLINNVFLVVEEKGTLIPLYNAAISWVQMIIVIIAIPYFSGIFKVPSNYISQNVFVMVSSFMFYFYMIWAVTFDPDIKKTSVSERTILATLLSFITFCCGMAVSFVPTESFLRALFLVSVVLFSLAYIQAHYKNRLNTRMIMEYGFISLIFFLILLAFNP